MRPAPTGTARTPPARSVRNGLFWVHHIRDAFLPEIDAFTRCLGERLLPTFSNLAAEAERVEQETWDRACSAPWCSEDVDPADLAEHGRDEALIFLDTMQGIEQGLINMFAAGLYHAFEQQLLVIHRRDLLDLHEQSNPKLWKIKEVKRRLKDGAIDVENFSAWPRVDELRLLANAVKHADGDSCAQLKKRRPDLFTKPRRYDPRPVDGSLRDAYLRAPVFQPLLGESIYVTKEHLEEYAGAIRLFWNELIDALERPVGGLSRARIYLSGAGDAGRAVRASAVRDTPSGGRS